MFLSRAMPSTMRTRSGLGIVPRYLLVRTTQNKKPPEFQAAHSSNEPVQTLKRSSGSFPVERRLDLPEKNTRHGHFSLEIGPEDGAMLMQSHGPARCGRLRLPLGSSSSRSLRVRK